MQLLNIVHPKPASWTELVDALQEELPSATIVLLRDWVQALELHDENDVSALEAYPAIKLKQFFNHLAYMVASQVTGGSMFDTNKATEASVTLRNMPMADRRSIRDWCSV